MLDYNATLFNGGLGYRWGPFKILGHDALMRTEALYRLDRHDAVPADGTSIVHKNFDDGLFNIGLVFPFGPAPHPPAPAVPETPPRVVPLNSAAQ